MGARGFVFGQNRREVYGHWARRQARLAGRRGLTLTELLAVLAVLAALAAVGLPAAGRAIGAGRKAQCLNNLRQVAVASLTAASDDADRLPRQFANADGVQGEWGDEVDGSGLGADWRPTRLFGSYLASGDVRVLACPSDVNYYPRGGMSSASYKHWFNRPRTDERRSLRDVPGCVIVSEHASNHGRSRALKEEDLVNYATLDGSVRAVRRADADYDDVHRWGTLANGRTDGPGPLP